MGKKKKKTVATKARRHGSHEDIMACLPRWRLFKDRTREVGTIEVFP